MSTAYWIIVAADIFLLGAFIGVLIMILALPVFPRRAATDRGLSAYVPHVVDVPLLDDEDASRP